MIAWAVTDLCKRFATGSWLRPVYHQALRGASLEVHAGERVALIGASGSGKTTLTRCGLGLMPVDSGRIVILGEDATRWSARRWARARRWVQVLFQSPGAMLHPSLPISTLLEESATLHRPGSDPTDEARRALEEVGLGGRGQALPRELSGGERRRAGIARLLLARPRLVIADEPTSGLDAALKAEMLDLLLERLGEECAVVVVSHDLAAVARACDRVAVMERGQVIEGFHTRDLRPGWRPRCETTARLLEASGWSPSPGAVGGA